MNVIAIVAHSRPELLRIYFEQLLKSDELQNYKVRIYTEEGYSPDLPKEVETFKKLSDVDIKIVINKDPYGCPLPAYYNIMYSYKLAAEESDEFVIIGEEDILPSKDYLRFNRECYERFLSKYDKIFCVCHKKRILTELHGRPEVVIGDIQCTSPSCISVDVIKKYINPVVEDPSFFIHPIRYNIAHYSNLRNPPNVHYHHDGQLERIAEANHMFCLKPDQARSMHVGVSGINCKGVITGTTDEKYLKYKELIKSGKKLRELSDNPKDMCVINPDGFEWKELILDINRTEERGSYWDFDDTNKFKTYIETGMNKVTLAGPFFGELGWELALWQSSLRGYKYSHPNERLIIYCRPGHKFIYQDFADQIIEVANPSNLNETDGVKLNGQYTRFSQRTIDNHRADLVITPTENFCLTQDKKHIIYKENLHRNETVILHARNTSKCGTEIRNWPQENWNRLAKYLIALGYNVYCVGSPEAAAMVENCIDMRGCSLETLCDMMAQSKLVIGPSSGPMHLASLCKTPHVVWTCTTYWATVNGTNRDRYERVWNPHNTPVKVIDKEGWQPSINLVLMEVKAFLKELHG